MNPINLQKMFPAYRITYDESYDVKGTRKATRDPWYMQIPCAKGITIYPHSDTMLAVEVNDRNVLAKRIQAVHEIVTHQDGHREKTFLFPPSTFDRIAAIVKPKKRRVVSEEQIERLKIYAFPKLPQ